MWLEVEYLDEKYFLDRIDFNLQHSFCDGTSHVDGDEDGGEDGGESGDEDEYMSELQRDKAVAIAKGRGEGARTEAPKRGSRRQS